MELEKLARIKKELANKILQSPLVNGIEIGMMDDHHPNDVGIRIFVSRDIVKFSDLGIAKRYRGAPIRLIYRVLRLQL